MKIAKLPPDYNGFSAAERNAGWEVQKRARAQGKLRYKRVCSICGVTAVAGACIIAHLEDYDDPIDGVLPSCVECHEWLHRRFDLPGWWRVYCRMLRDGHRPEPWANILAFRYRWKAPVALGLRGGLMALVKIEVEPFTPDATKWWEMLSPTPIDLRRGGAPMTAEPEKQLDMESRFRALAVD